VLSRTLVILKSLFVAVTTSEALPPYEVIASRPRGKPADLSITIDQHPQPPPRPRPHLHPHSPAALNNISLGAVQVGPPRPPTDVEAVRQPDGSVLIRWTASGDLVDHYVLQYRTVGGWLPLMNRLDAGSTSHVWRTASRGVVYRFRLLGVSRNSGDSLPSNVATLHVNGLEFLSMPVHIVLTIHDLSNRVIADDHVGLGRFS